MKKTALTISTALLMCACTTTQFYVPAGSENQFNQDKARCEYESALAVQTPIYGSTTMVGDAFDIASRRGDLQVMCMKSKGWMQAGR